MDQILVGNECAPLKVGEKWLEVKDREGMRETRGDVQFWKKFPMIIVGVTPLLDFNGTMSKQQGRFYVYFYKIVLLVILDNC